MRQWRGTRRIGAGRVGHGHRAHRHRHWRGIACHRCAHGRRSRRGRIGRGILSRWILSRLVGCRRVGIRRRRGGVLARWVLSGGVLSSGRVGCGRIARRARLSGRLWQKCHSGFCSIGRRCNSGRGRSFVDCPRSRIRYTARTHSGRKTLIKRRRVGRKRRWVGRNRRRLFGGQAIPATQAGVVGVPLGRIEQALFGGLDFVEQTRPLAGLRPRAEAPDLGRGQFGRQSNRLGSRLKPCQCQ